MQLFESAEKMQSKDSETMGPSKRQASKLGFNNRFTKECWTLASDIRDELAITYLEHYIYVVT